MNRLLTKTEQEERRGECTCLPSPEMRGEGGYGRTPYNDLNRVAPTESGTFFVSQLYERVGLLLVLCLAERFFSRCSGFPLSPKTNLSKCQFDPERTDTSLSGFLTTSKCSAGKQITN